MSIRHFHRFNKHRALLDLFGYKKRGVALAVAATYYYCYLLCEYNWDGIDDIVGRLEERLEELKDRATNTIWTLESIVPMSRS